MKRHILIACLCFVALPVLAGWQTIQLPETTNIADLCVIEDQNVWVVGNEGLLVHYTGIDWDTVDIGITSNLNAIAMVNDTDGWIVGDEGIVLHLVQGVWEAIPDLDEQVSFEDIAIIATNNVYVIGYGFTQGGIVLHWDGSVMTEIIPAGGDSIGNIQDIVADSPNNIWAVGPNFGRLHYDGTDWTFDNSTMPASSKPGEVPTDKVNLYGVTLDENGNPMVCGTRFSTGIGYIYSYTPSAGWTIAFDDWEHFLLDIDTAETTGFAVGNYGKVVQNTIYGWQKTATLFNNQINSVANSDMARAWAVCDSGLILRYTAPAIDMLLSAEMFEPGIEFDLSATLMNPGSEIHVQLFVLLEAYGTFYFWPGWADTVDFESRTLTADTDQDESILTFVWPDVGGPGEAKFWGALLDGEDLISYDTEVFSWQ